MNGAIRRCVLVTALTLCAAVARGQDELGPYERYQRGIAALEAKDAARALPDLEAAASVFRRDPDVLNALAKARALTGDTDGAIAALSRAVALGYGAGADTDPAFASLGERPDFRALLPKIVANGRPLGSARVAFTLSEADLIPEGIAWDPGSRRLFVGSLARNKIVAISADGRVSDFVPSGRDGLRRVLGMKVDAPRKSLWVCSAEADSPSPGGNATRASTLFRFDLATGKTLRKISSPPGGTHLFNDIAIEKDGGLFLTDSEEGAVYRLRAGRDTLDVFQAAGRFFYPNGIALSDDGRYLYVAHVLGVAAWELATGRSVDGVGAVTFDLPSPDAVTIVGIDGLSFHRGGLVAIQNGMEPNRVAYFPLAPSLDRVTGERVLERGNRNFEIPTTGAVAGNSYYVIANSQLRSLGPEGVKDPEKRKPVVILEIDLPR